MKKLLPILALLALFATNSAAQDQLYYTVQVGTFIDAKPMDFKSLQPIAFVHAQDLGNNLREVYVGGYASQKAAEEAAAKVRSKGFPNAFVKEKILSSGQTVNVVQVATRRTDKEIEWEKLMKAGDLYGILSGNLIKVVTGPYSSLQAAEADKARIRKLGYKDAFAKAVNSAHLHRLTEFETGVKRELIPIAFDQYGGAVPMEPQLQEYNDLAARTPYGDNPVYGYGYGSSTPADYSYVPAANPTSPYTPVTSLPNIRSDVKRLSVENLQRVLRAENVYTSSIDGYYGNGTAKAYQDMLQKDRELRKYQALAESASLPGSTATDNRLQEAINGLATNSSAFGFLERSNDPMAMAYRAYMLLSNYGPSANVNQLMNTAIRTAFSGRLATGSPLNPNVNYAYQSPGELALHLYYLHCGSATSVSAPCWLAERHAQEASIAYRSCASGALRLQNCGQFDNWPEAKLLLAVASDLNTEEKFNEQRLAQAATERSRLYSAPSALNSSEAKAVEAWNSNLLRGLDRWALQDPLHREIVTAFKVGYFQTQVRLEDYFMAKGYNVAQSRGLALATLHTLVAYHMQRFV